MVTIERLHELFTYDPLDGVVRWKVKRRPHRRRGCSRGLIPEGSAGSLNHKGYLHIILPTRETLLAHRVAWAMHYGVWPAQALDHRNNDKTDNRIENLREVTDRENSQNRHAVMVTNKLGVLGVKRSGKRFRADIQVDGRCIYLGTFSTPEIAHQTYIEAKRRLHAAFSG